MNAVVTRQGGWFRLWSRGPGLSWKNGPALFSERYGYDRPIVRVGSWRIFTLSRVT
jgi:hypothetical protein